MTEPRPHSPSPNPGTGIGIRWLVVGLLLSSLTWPSLTSSESLDLSEAVLAQVERQYGYEARARVTAWRDLMAASSGLPEAEKLGVTNEFLNRLEFVEDAVHWQQPDYWATPLETLATGGGDCEDLAITKYFTLKEIGVPEARLRLTYVKALTLDQAHMVLTYYRTPDATPLILDNLVSEVKPATARADLVPVYSFNGSGLWLAKQRGAGKRVGEAERLDLWRDLLQRIGRESR